MRRERLSELAGALGLIGAIVAGALAADSRSRGHVEEHNRTQHPLTAGELKATQAELAAIKGDIRVIRVQLESVAEDVRNVAMATGAAEAGEADWRGDPARVK